MSGERLKAAASYAGEHLALSIDGSYLVAKSDAVCKLNTLDAAEYQPDCTADFKASKVSPTELAKGIESVSFCAMKSESRPIMKSVHVIGGGEMIVCEACDGSNGAFYEFKAEQVFDFIISTKSTQRIISALNRDGAKIFISDNIIKVEHKFGSYWCKQLDGKYPDLQTRRKDKDYLPSVNIGEVDAGQIAAALGCAIDMQPDPSKMNAVDTEFGPKGVKIFHANFNRTIPGKFIVFKASLNASTAKDCFTAFSGKVALATGEVKFLHLSAGQLSAMSMPLRENKEEPAK